MQFAARVYEKSKKQNSSLSFKQGKTIFQFYIEFQMKTFFPGCFAIELRHVRVPSFAVQGRNAVLECDYDLEGQALYSVKWYKNGIEFFR